MSCRHVAVALYAKIVMIAGGHRFCQTGWDGHQILDVDDACNYFDTIGQVSPIDYTIGFDGTEAVTIHIIIEDAVRMARNHLSRLILASHNRTAEVFTCRGGWFYGERHNLCAQVATTHALNLERVPN